MFSIRLLLNPMRDIYLVIILLFCLYHSSKAQWVGFLPPSNYHSTRNYYVLLKDINNDTYPDIITANVYTNGASNFGLRLNDKTGHFKNEELIPITAGYTVWDFADLNKDGITDILTSYYWDNGLRVYLGTGVTAFSEGPLMPTGTHGWLSKIADTDGDGNPDLVSISNGSGNPSRLHIFKGKGDGSFFPKITYESPYTNAARNLNVIDINQDGLPDIVMAASYVKIPVFIQNPDHSFTSKEIPVERGESFDNAIGDINNDGIPDIVYGGGTFPFPGFTDTIRIILGKGNGLFKPSYTTPGLSSIMNPLYVRLADLNQDKNLDIITFDFFTKDVYYFLGRGDSTFAPPVKLTINDTINNFEVEDVNHDGFPDIITINKDSTLSVILNKGGTTNIKGSSIHPLVTMYPNPFQEFVTIELSLTINARVKIQICDIYGRKVWELVNGNLENSNYRYQWHPNVSSGIYLLNVMVNESQNTYRLIHY